MKGKPSDNNEGFTLLELLLVVAILAVLSVALVLVLNPSETLRKSRDVQRLSDLATIKTAIGLYLTNANPPYLGGIASNAACKAVATGAWGAGNKIFYSLAGVGGITDATLDGGVGSVPAPQQAATPALIDGTGWIPVNFSTYPGGTPISNLPVDPINTISNLASVSSTDLVYRYGCAILPFSYEIEAQLESNAYTVVDNKRITDGGNNVNYYETGTNLFVFGAGTDF